MIDGLGTAAEPFPGSLYLATIATPIAFDGLEEIAYRSRNISMATKRVNCSIVRLAAAYWACRHFACLVT